jgi:tRNA pseudouridine38-40 synthase
MTLFRITLAYDGTDFAGWQSQSARKDAGPTGARTVQGTLEAALRRLAGGQAVTVFGAGRTDAGVHARGQVASFDLARAMEPRALLRALNALLPEDVRVLEAACAPPGFHARKSALSKSYRYVLDTAPVQLPIRRRMAAHFPGPLDREAVTRLAALYVGRHDFAALASAGSSVRTTERTVLRSEPCWRGETLRYEVEADGFLRKMVRSLVGGLLAAGRGARRVDDLEQALEGRDRSAWPPPAPAHGLTLVAVRYPGPDRRG